MNDRQIVLDLSQSEVRMLRDALKSARQQAAANARRALHSSNTDTELGWLQRCSRIDGLIVKLGVAQRVAEADD